MPERVSYSPTSKSNISATKTKKKSDRSHEENRERAYIAASRRADRSITARMQSARMASEIHKKRTGKSFRLTEAIVVQEEMYEEEDDHFRGLSRLLRPHIQTRNAEMNSRFETFLANKVAGSRCVGRGGEIREKEMINELFAVRYPDLDAQVKALHQCFSNTNYESGATQHHETPEALSTNVSHPQSPSPPVSPAFQHLQALIANECNDSATSDLPRLSTPGSPSSETTSSFSVSDSMDFGRRASACTADLVHEARMLSVGIAPTAQDLYGQVSMFDPALGMDWMAGAQQSRVYDPKLERNETMMFDAANTMQSPALKPDPTLPGNTQANDDDWNDFINEHAWVETQVQ